MEKETLSNEQSPNEIVSDVPLSNEKPHKENYPKLFKSLFRLTANERTPTDIELDEEISKFQWAFRTGYPLAKNIAKHKFKRFFKYRWKFALKRIILVILIAMPTYYASVWYYKYKANSKIINVPLMQENKNGLIKNKK